MARRATSSRHPARSQTPSEAHRGRAAAAADLASGLSDKRIRLPKLPKADDVGYPRGVSAGPTFSSGFSGWMACVVSIVADFSTFAASSSTRPRRCGSWPGCSAPARRRVRPCADEDRGVVHTTMTGRSAQLRAVPSGPLILGLLLRYGGGVCALERRSRGSWPPPGRGDERFMAPVLLRCLRRHDRLPFVPVVYLRIEGPSTA